MDHKIKGIPEYLSAQVDEEVKKQSQEISAALIGLMVEHFMGQFIRDVFCSLHPDESKWCAKIGFRGTTYYLGTFNKKEDAIKARREGEELHDDFIEWYYSQYLPSRQKKITANQRFAGVE